MSRHQITIRDRAGGVEAFLPALLDRVALRSLEVYTVQRWRMLLIAGEGGWRIAER